MQLLQLSLLTASLISLTNAVGPAKNCGLINKMKCPQGLNPCCSQFGECGAGAFCLGGCDPRYSATQDSCMPAPISQGGSWPFSSRAQITDAHEYLGDASKADWVMMEGGEMTVDDKSSVTLKMGKEKAQTGTVFSSASYIWYGKVKASIKSSRGAGVVTGFMLFGNTRDEIDFEWTGNDLGKVQTNFYFQGVENHTNFFHYPTPEKPNPAYKPFNTFSEWHEYEIDWTPDSIKWKMDGVLIREKKKADTMQSDGLYHYPQTPCRVQFSIWPGGAANAPTGQRDWAGGNIDWVNHPDIKEMGYYYTSIKDVSITPYEPPKGTKIDGKKSYTWMNPAKNWTQEEVVMSDASSILASPISNGQPSSKVWSLVSEENLKGIETLPGLVGTGRIVLGGSKRKDGVISAYSGAARVVVARLAVVAAVFAVFI